MAAAGQEVWESPPEDSIREGFIGLHSPIALSDLDTTSEVFTHKYLFTRKCLHFSGTFWRCSINKWRSFVPSQFISKPKFFNTCANTWSASRKQCMNYGWGVLLQMFGLWKINSHRKRRRAFYAPDWEAMPEKVWNALVISVQRDGE